jgi:hypothetical protein
LCLPGKQRYVAGDTLENPQDELHGCADIARALARQAASDPVSPESLDLLADKIEEAARLLDGERIERWVEVIRDDNGVEREVHTQTR